MLIDFFSRLRVVYFFILLIFVSLVSIALLILVPGSTAAVTVSLLTHGFLVLLLSWFLLRIVRPVRAGFDRLITLIEKFDRQQKPERSAKWGVDLGSHPGILDEAIKLIEKQYEFFLAHSSQLENFTDALERQNRKINESRQRYRRTLDALADGIYLVDDSFTIRAINRAEAAYFGATPRDLVGKHCYQVFRKQQVPCPDCLPRECMVDGKSHSRLRVRKRRAGREYVNIHCYPIFHEGETGCREVVVYIQDTSSLTEMEDRVIRTEKMASIGQMAAGIAHDLNNFLAGIYGVVQLLQMHCEAAPEPREKEIRLLGRLQDQVEALNLMAGNLMVFSHPERKEMFPLSLVQIIEDALTFSRYELEREQVRVIKEFAWNLPMVKCEKGQIQQVLLNLLLNAAQAIRERKQELGGELAGRIVIAVNREDEEHLFFSVTDNGVGIGQDSREYIFDPFYSTKKVDAERGATGLGLFTARTIVEQHQGRIEFTSTPGQGSCFKVILPLRPDENSCDSVP